MLANPTKRFREEDWGVTVAAPSIRHLHLVMHDFEPGWDISVERPGYGLEADLSFDQVDVGIMMPPSFWAAALLSTSAMIGAYSTTTALGHHLTSTRE
jgi:hypothetical protein